ncbi:MAG: aminotransferase class I/II-fold pyridoxal phosphate-dependent enzyme [Acidobacteriota bacterium]|nr:aminotransferase class I/II-fold pyridoxal phosphate-dependent enzyme [Blastocatellia bacterium]MDW8238934.1 aminotransferase class I/II-fold pyridoxal phosphate-dependent enzyme [Acidobacteriota bacterium]
MVKQHRGKKEDYRMRTHLIHGNFESKRWDFDHHIIPPMSASSAYRLGSVHRGAQGFVEFASEEAELSGHMPIYIYDRLDEPTRGLLEENLAYAEGGETAVCFATGMAAISAAIGVTTKAGDEIVAHHILYGCTYSLFTNWLPRCGIQVRFADLTKVESFSQAVTDRTRVVYFETPVNPTMELIDIAQVRRWSDEIKARYPHRERLIMIVDNTFATPYCQRPLALGADLVVQSLTKNIGGFGTDMGGAVIGPLHYHGPLLMYRKDFGGVLSPKNAWPILVYGLPTLATRMVNQQKSALRIAQFLERHPKVARVSYPGLESFPQYELARRQMVSYDGKFAPGSMIYFVLKGDEKTANEAAERFIDYIATYAYSITLAVSLGQIRTLIEEPYSMTHSALPDEVKRQRGLEPGAIRLSVGLEDWHDIIEDLRVAFEHV